MTKNQSTGLELLVTFVSRQKYNLASWMKEDRLNEGGLSFYHLLHSNYWLAKLAFDVIVQFLGVAVLAQFGKGFGFDLANAFAGNGKFLADFF